jgi:putative colanic acid biosynthesis glycosyltransferase WcaI
VRGRAGRVAVVAANYWPEPTGTSQTVTEFAEFLARSGAEVRVATGLPYYPQWQIYPGYRRALYRSERRNGVTILRAWHHVRTAPSALGRIVQELTLCLFALPTLIRALWGARLAYVVSPALSYAFVGACLARGLRIPVVLVVKDVMPEAAVETGLLRNRALIAVGRWLARRLYGVASEIQTLGEGMARRIVAAGAAPAKVRVVPDTIDARELAPVPVEQNEFRRRFVPRGSFAVVHTGNMGRKQDLDLLLRTADRLRAEPDIRFFVFGDGTVRGEFLRRCAQLGLENVVQQPLQDRSFLAHMLSGADVLLVSQLAEVVDIVVPSKLVTALGAGAMIVAACADESETARLIRASEGGVVVAAGDDAALARTILAVRDGGVDTAGYRARARAYAVSRFDRDAVYGPLAAEVVAA